MGISKRGMMRAIWGVTTVGVGGAAALTLGSDPASAQTTGFSASDITINSNDGTVSSLTMAPSINVTWDGQEQKVGQVKTSWYVSDPSLSSESQVGSQTTTDVSSPTTSNESAGGMDLSLGTFNMISNGPLSADNYTNSDESTNLKKDVSISMDLVLATTGGDIITTKTDAVSATYTVTVNNRTSTVTATGSANTGGS